MLMGKPMTTTDKNRYMAEYMRRYRARKAAERAKLRAQAENREPNIEAVLTQILEAMTALSERVGRIEEALSQFNVKGSKGTLSELTENNVKPNVSKLTDANVNKGKPSAKGQVLRGRVNVKDNKLTETNVNTGKQHSDSSTAEELAREAKTLHAKGLSYEQIAKRWTEEGKPTLKGGRWHKGTVAKMIQRHVGQ
jgi:hypothetical protein